MKLAYKASGLMALLSLLTLFLLMVIFSLQNEQLAIENAKANLALLANQISEKVSTRLESKAAISLAFSSAPVVASALIGSNREYEALSDAERSKKIEELNSRWEISIDDNDPLVQERLNNNLANYFKLQQINMPGLYGEIFLTNRFGVMIASTGKLTTLAHAHKYWWREAFDGGTGKIFFDDRGFDKSVAGYVVGIVIPIKVNNEIVGILKSNINVMELLDRTVSGYAKNNFGEMRVVRSGGLIVAGQGVTPLSQRMAEDRVRYLDRKQSRVVHFKDTENSSLMMSSPIAITMGAEMFSFGGSAESVDHSKGNVGDGWHVVITVDDDEALSSATEATELIVFLGVIFAMLITVAALLFGKNITRALVRLTDATKNIGRGDFDIKTDVGSQDEVGVLADSFNKMAINLKQTMISRDALAEETKERKSLNELLLESAADGIFGVDVNGMATFVNPAATGMLGYSIDEMLNQPVSVLITKNQLNDGFIDCLNRVITGEIAGSDACCCSDVETFSRNDGSSFSAEYAITAIKQNDNTIGAVVTFRDISERIKMADESRLLQRQLLQSQKMEAIGKLTGGVAHDFNNMLSAILGYSNLAIEVCGKSGQNVACDQADTLRKYVNEVIKAGDRSKNLVAQLLAFSRGDMGEIKCLKLNHYIEDVMQMLRATIPSSIELISLLPEGDIYVKTGEVQLNQIIMNLVINARDAIENQIGIIEVGISKFQINDKRCSSCHDEFSGDFIELFVRDTGSGMKNGVVENIFDPFFTTKGIGSGAGMGLAMVHGIVHASGGHIHVQTKAGGGTTITLFFPEVIMESYEVENQAKISAEQKQTVVGHILVVDDEELIGALVKEQLSQAGYEVTLFTNPLAALERFNDSPDQFDLVITDQTMPELTGDNLSRRLLEIRNDIPIILCTGFSEVIDEEQALEIGVSQFMSKPLAKDKLLNAISQLLGA